MTTNHPAYPGPLTAAVSGLVAGYGEREVLGPVDLTLHPGVTALLGRNGSGKSTLMRTLCGVIPPLRGRCTVLGEAVADGAEVRSRVGYLGHESALAAGLTVTQNLRFWSDITSTAARGTVLPLDELAERFDLGPVMNTKVSALSRGQRQRADLARLAMTDPEFIVLDDSNPEMGGDVLASKSTAYTLAA